MCDVSFFSRAHLVEHCHKLTSMGHVTDEILHQLIFISSRVDFRCLQLYKLSALWLCCTLGLGREKLHFQSVCSILNLENLQSQYSFFIASSHGKFKSLHGRKSCLWAQ
jgi:hypothetical protein